MAGLGSAAAAVAAAGLPSVLVPSVAPGSSRLAKIASQSCESVALAPDAEPPLLTLLAVVAGLPPGTTTALPPVEEPRLAKSKLLSAPNGAVVPVRFDSDLVAWDAGGDESKTGL
jgi:hypothetical protein